MKFLHEAIKSFRRIDDERQSEERGDRSSDELNLDVDDNQDEDQDSNREDDTDTSDNDSDELNLDVDDSNTDEDQDDNQGESDDGENLDDDPDDSNNEDQDDELNLDVTDDNQQTQDPNKQGLIRTVPKAHLVYKREVEDGAFEELWLYNVTTLRDELSVRRAILAGTDIPPSRMQSPDGSQTYTMWSAGNAELVLVSGLPN